MRKTNLSAALFPAVLSLASCNGAATGDTAPTSTASASTPGDGETVELAAESPFSATAHATLAEPWAVAVEPGTGNLFITEKAGTAKYMDVASGTMMEITGLPEVAYGGQGGLGDIAFAPDYETSGTVYLSWAKAAGGDARRAVAGMGTFSCDGTACAVSGLTEIWQQEPAIASNGHFSHRFQFSPDGEYLFISSGDRQQQDPAQDLSNNLGTVVRLLPDGTPAPGNPFADRSAPTNQIWSYGQRNILGLQFDPAGNLWGLEHGPAGGDELNLVEPGNNYGWPVRSNGNNYNGDPIPDHAEDDGFVKPAIYWNPVIAPGNFVFYTGEMFADWQGEALIANLGTQSIVRISTDAGANGATELARYEFPNRLRGIAEAPDGALWVIEDGDGGRLLRLTPAG